jgi:hypothetical protein
VVAKEVVLWRVRRTNRGGDWISVGSQGERPQPASSLTFATTPEYSHEVRQTQSFLAGRWQRYLLGRMDFAAWRRSTRSRPLDETCCLTRPREQHHSKFRDQELVPSSIRARSRWGVGLKGPERRSAVELVLVREERAAGRCCLPDRDFHLATGREFGRRHQDSRVQDSDWLRQGRHSRQVR